MNDTRRRLLQPEYPPPVSRARDDFRGMAVLWTFLTVLWVCCVGMTMFLMLAAARWLWFHAHG